MTPEEWNQIEPGMPHRYRWLARLLRGPILYVLWETEAVEIAARREGLKGQAREIFAASGGKVKLAGTLYEGIYDDEAS